MLRGALEPACWPEPGAGRAPRLPRPAASCAEQLGERLRVGRRGDVWLWLRSVIVKSSATTCRSAPAAAASWSVEGDRATRRSDLVVLAGAEARPSALLTAWRRLLPLLGRLAGSARRAAERARLGEQRVDVVEQLGDVDPAGDLHDVGRRRPCVARVARVRQPALRVDARAPRATGRLCAGLAAGTARSLLELLEDRVGDDVVRALEADVGLVAGRGQRRP